MQVSFTSPPGRDIAVRSLLRTVLFTAALSGLAVLNPFYRERDGKRADGSKAAILRRKNKTQA